MDSDIARKAAQYLRQRCENDIGESRTMIIQRLLDRQEEMRDVYKQLAKHGWPVCEIVLDLIIDTAALHSPERTAKKRAAMKEAERIKTRIASQAKEMAGLLRQYSQLSADYSITAPLEFHCPFMLMEFATKTTGSADLAFRYRNWIRPELDTIFNRFDTRYYPDLPEMLEALAEAAGEHDAEPGDGVSATVMMSQKSSPADFYRAMVECLSFQTPERGGLLPGDFKLTNASWANITNAALGLNAKQIDENNIKQWKRDIDLT